MKIEDNPEFVELAKKGVLSEALMSDPVQKPSAFSCKTARRRAGVDGWRLYQNSARRGIH